MNSTAADTTPTADLGAPASPVPVQDRRATSRRVARFASAILDAALFGVAPLLPALIVSLLHRPAVPARMFDDLGQLRESFRSGPFDSLTAKVALLAPVFLVLVAQWLSLASSAQTIGQRVCGIGFVTATGEKAGFARTGILRTLVLCVMAAGISRLIPPFVRDGWVLVLPAVSVIAVLVLDGVSALASDRRTVRDRIFGLNAVVFIDPRRAFEPARFSGVAFVTAIFGSAAAALVAGGIAFFIARFTSLESTDIDIPSVVGGLTLPLCLIVAGGMSAYFARRFVLGELALVSLLVALLGFEAMVVGVAQVPALQRYMQPGMLDWIVYSLGTYFGLLIFLIIGSTFGFMVTGDRGVDASTNFERQIARRHLRLKLGHFLALAAFATWLPLLVYIVLIWPVRSVYKLMRIEKVGRPMAPTVFMSILSIVAVMLGVTALDVVLGVMGGFERDLKDKILGTNAHGVIHRLIESNANEFTEWRHVQDTVRETRGVSGVTPFVYGEVMITRGNYVTGAMLKGIDPNTIGQVTDLKKQIDKGDGKLSYLSDPKSVPTSFRSKHPDGEEGAEDEKGEGVVPVIAIGREMANSLQVWIGDTISVMNPLGDIGPQGPIPRSMTFRVGAIFVSGMYEFDSKQAYISLPDAQRFFRMGDAITGLELKFSNVDDARPIIRTILGKIGRMYRGKDWGEMNANLFSALRLERVVMFLILCVAVLIACIGVVGTLVMLVIEKRKEVATLKSMGARDGSIMKLFVLEGLMIGGLGTFYGSAAGYFFCKLIEKFGVGLNAEVYYIDKLPVVIEPVAFLSVAIVAMILVFVATIYPARRGGSIAPVEGFREE